MLRTGNLDAAARLPRRARRLRRLRALPAHADRFAAGTILNIASGTARRIGDVLAGLLAVSGLAVRIEHDAARARPTDIPLAVGDARRLRDRLGWRRESPWQRTLRDVLDDWTLRIAEEL